MILDANHGGKNGHIYFTQGHNKKHLVPNGLLVP